MQRQALRGMSFDEGARALAPVQLQEAAGSTGAQPRMYDELEEDEAAKPDIVDPYSETNGWEQWGDNLDKGYTAGGKRGPRTKANGIYGADTSVEDYRAAIGTKDHIPKIQSASDWSEERAAGNPKAHRARKLVETNLTGDDILEVVPTLAPLVKDNPDRQFELDQCAKDVSIAFRICKIDTVQAQAAYLAQSAGEIGFAWLTEGQVRDEKGLMEDPNKELIPNAPDKTKINGTDGAGPIRYASNYKDSVDPAGQIDAKKNPTFAHTFIGRGGVQVTHDYYYVQALIYMEEMAKTTEPADAKLLWEAIGAIKQDPRNAGLPQYAHLFSMAFMHMSGGARASAQLVDRSPNFQGGGDPGSSWVAGMDINTITDEKDKASALRGAAIKVGAYGRALALLNRKADQQDQASSPYPE